MAKHKESGRTKLIKGSLIYIWEELKTLNFRKLRAIGKILVGYLKMRYFGPKRIG